MSWAKLQGAIRRVAEEVDALARELSKRLKARLMTQRDDAADTIKLVQTSVTRLASPPCSLCLSANDQPCHMSDMHTQRLARDMEHTGTRLASALAGLQLLPDMHKAEQAQTHHSSWPKAECLPILLEPQQALQKSLSGFINWLQISLHGMNISCTEDYDLMAWLNIVCKTSRSQGIACYIALAPAQNLSRCARSKARLVMAHWIWENSPAWGMCSLH